MTLKFGTAGWSYRDWEGIVYTRASAGLETISRFLDMVEVNSSFYHIPSQKMVETWPRKTENNPAFTFVLKLWQGFTHSPDWSKKDEEFFLAACRILSSHGRLGGILAQFPFYTAYSESEFTRMQRIAGLFSEFRLFTEFRHVSWFEPEIKNKVQEAGILYCNIDIPGGDRTFNRTEETDEKGAYIRLHGRNSDAWFSKDAGRDQKYDYLYSEKEITEVVKRIRSVSEKAGTSFIVANNHFKGKAVANSLQLKSVFSQGRVAAPDTLVHEYPFLSSIADTGGLFS